MGNAEEITRRRLAAEQQEREARQEATERMRQAMHERIAAEVSAEIPLALARLKAKGYPGAAGVERFVRNRFFLRPVVSEFAYWYIYAGQHYASSWSDFPEDYHVRLYSDGSIGSRDLTIMQFDENSLQVILQSLKSLGT